MEPRVKRPAKLRSPWPPTDAQKAQTVTSWDDWWALATIFKRDDPWDIIYYNFETYDPDEVNWYLREWLGCRATSNDGLNYRFGRAPGDHTPMVIFIPKPDFMPPGPHQKEAQQAVLTVLRDPVAAHLGFKIGRMELKNGDLTAVALAIQSGKIRVVHRPTLGHMAQYLSSNPNNWMAVGFDRLPPIGGRALIVHEAVHAAFDIRRVPQTMEQAEAMAYIAQALYMRRYGIDIGNSVVQPAFNVNPSNFIAWTGIFTRASAIAKAIDRNDVSDVDIVLLAAALHLTETYRNEGAPANDGV
jgi:hypothetical protein